MPRRREPIVGIDLGTTFSVVAHLDARGRPATLPNAEGDYTTPSVVFFDAAGAIVGKEAVKAAEFDPDRVAETPQAGHGPAGLPPARPRRANPPGGAASRHPQEAQGRRRVRLGPLTTGRHHRPGLLRRAPAGGHRRTPGGWPGWDVIDILNEPTAAAIAYGVQQGFLDARERADDAAGTGPRLRPGRRHLRRDRHADPRPTSSRPSPPTATCDSAAATGTRRSWTTPPTGLPGRAPRRRPARDPETLQALFQATEGVKKSLSERSKTRLVYAHRGRRVGLETDPIGVRGADGRAPGAHPGHDQARPRPGRPGVGRDRKLLSPAARPGCRRSPGCSASCPARSRIGRSPPTKRSPRARPSITESCWPTATIAPPRPGRTSVVNVNAHSLGLVTVARNPTRFLNSTLIPRNTPLPHSGKQAYRTITDGQERIMIRLLEGEAIDPADCISIGEFVIQPLPPGLPKGTPVSVHYAYDAGGRIKVKAVVEAPWAMPR